MRVLPPTVALLAVLAASAGVHAATEKLRLGIFGQGKGAGPLLTKAELRDCLALQERVRGGSQEALRERDELEKRKAELLREREDIRAALDKLDVADAQAVEQHKARALAHDQAVEAFGTRSGAFNGMVGALEADRASFQQRCDNRRFDQADEEALRKGR